MLACEITNLQISASQRGRCSFGALYPRTRKGVGPVMCRRPFIARRPATIIRNHSLGQSSPPMTERANILAHKIRHVVRGTGEETRSCQRAGNTGGGGGGTAECGRGM